MKKTEIKKWKEKRKEKKEQKKEKLVIKVCESSSYLF